MIWSALSSSLCISMNCRKEPVAALARSVASAEKPASISSSFEIASIACSLRSWIAISTLRRSGLLTSGWAACGQQLVPRRLDLRRFGHRLRHQIRQLPGALDLAVRIDRLDQPARPVPEQVPPVGRLAIWLRCGGVSILSSRDSRKPSDEAVSASMLPHATASSSV